MNSFFFKWQGASYAVQQCSEAEIILLVELISASITTKTSLNRIIMGKKMKDVFQFFKYDFSFDKSNDFKVRSNTFHHPWEKFVYVNARTGFVHCNHFHFQ